MAEGNGIDLAAIYQLLAIVASDVREMKDTKADKADLAKTNLEMASLRQTIVEYHSSVIGHGILISELDERLRRLERRVDTMSA